MNAPVLQLMSRKACCLCEDAEVVLNAFVAQGRCQLNVLDVDQDISLAARYGMDVPVLLKDGSICCMHRIEHDDVENILLEDLPC